MLGRILSPGGEMTEGPGFLPGMLQGGKEGRLRTLVTMRFWR